MNKNILLAGAALITSVATPALAQNAPVVTREVCEGEDKWRLVNDGAASPLRQIRYYEVSSPFDDRYDPSMPLATCGDAIQQVPLKCVNDKGEVSNTDVCTRGAIDEYNRQHPGWMARKKYDGTSYTYEATRETQLESCDKRTYTWMSVDGSDAAVCGTGEITVQVSCIDFETKQAVYEGYCDASKRPESKKTVTSRAGCGYDFKASAWSEVPETCGKVQQTRTVTCVGPDGQPASESDCGNYLTPDAQRLKTTGIPVTEFWSKGAYYWPDVGSANPYGNYISIWKMPTLCDVGGMEEIRAECEHKYQAKDGLKLAYLRPRESRLVSSSATCPTPTPTPSPTPGEDGEGDATYKWNSPAYVVDNASMCGQNTKTGRVFCTKESDGVEVDDSFCDPSQKPPATLTFEDVSGCTPTPTGTTSPTPTVSPTPVIQEPVVQPDPEPVALYAGYCGYTSGGGSGRHACGPMGDEAAWASGASRQIREWKSKGAAHPSELCTGSLIAGDLRGEYVGEYPAPSFYPAGKNWSILPQTPAMKGARCVVWYKMGYNDNGSQTSWASLYYSGPPSGIAAGHYIAKKP